MSLSRRFCFTVSILSRCLLGVGVSVSLLHSDCVSQVFVAKEQQSYCQGEDLEDLEDDEKEELKAKLELGLSKVTIAPAQSAPLSLHIAPSSGASRLPAIRAHCQPSPCLLCPPISPLNLPCFSKVTENCCSLTASHCLNYCCLAHCCLTHCCLSCCLTHCCLSCCLSRSLSLSFLLFCVSCPVSSC